MEVHSHTHSERKKWTHYLWEFLMLFLAVFCGFLAENQREHMVEYGNDPAPASMNYQIDSLMDKNKVPVASEDQTVLMFEFENKLIALKRDYYSNVNWGYTNARRMINELINTIRENYHLE